MKVVFTSQFKEETGGGAGRVAHELAQSFAKSHQTAIIYPASKTGLQTKKHGLKSFGVKSAEQKDIHFPNLSQKTVKEIFNFLNDFQPDVIHAHDPVLLGLIGQIWAKMNLVPFVHTAHILPSKALEFGTNEALNIKIIPESFSEAVTKRILSDFYKNCDALVALNQTAAKSIRQFNYQGRVFIIPNGRNLKKYKSTSFPDIKQKQKNLIFVGYLTERKNQDFLIKAMKFLPKNYHLQLLGTPLNPNFAIKLKKYCQDNNLDNVNFLGKVDHNKVPQHLSNAHLFVSASKKEVQSLAVIEALASGTPVLGLPNETIDQLVNEDVGYKLDKHTSPQQFAQKIQQLCQLPEEEYLSLCQNAQESVSKLSWSNIVKKTALAYQKLIDQKPIPSQKQKNTLINLTSKVTSGKTKDFLINKINQLQNRTKKPFPKTSKKIKGISRIPGSTWLISGITMIISSLGYFFLKNKSSK